MTFQQILDKLRDGKEYIFGCPNLPGHFHKAPYPEQDWHTKKDGACSAITFRGAPKLTMLLSDFDEDCWNLIEVKPYMSDVDMDALAHKGMPPRT